MKRPAITSAIAFITLALIPAGCGDGAREQADLIISGGTVVTVNAEMQVIEDGGIVVSGGEIVFVGSRQEAEKRYKAGDKIEASGKIVMPGLVNAHTHIPMVALRGYADDLPLEQWLKDDIWPAEAKEVTAEHVYKSSRLAIAEMISSGTTTFNDMYFYEEEVARAAKEAGMRAVVGEALVTPKSPDSQDAAEELERARDLILKYKDDPLIIPAVTPHSTYALSTDLLKEGISLSNEYGTPLHIHLSESAGEVATIEGKYGMRPVEHLDSVGGLGERTVCAHCVQVDGKEIALIKSRGAGVAFTIQSEMKLADGVPPVPAMLAAGLKVGMGTDGAASNNDLNMFEEMNSAALVLKAVSGDPTVADARSVVRMATMGGAEVLGLEDRIGSLETGKRADIIIIDLDRPKHVPMYEPHSHLVYVVDGCDVSTVVIDGRVVMRDGELLTVDEKKAMEEVRQIAEDLKKTRPDN